MTIDEYADVISRTALRVALMDHGVDHLQTDDLMEIGQIVDELPQFYSKVSCKSCKHYMGGEYDGACDSYICKDGSGYEPNDDLISRQATMEICRKLWCGVGDYMQFPIAKEISALPAMRQRGRWIENGSHPHICSKCGVESTSVKTEDGIIVDSCDNFCPACGSDMRRRGNE